MFFSDTSLSSYTTPRHHPQTTLIVFLGMADTLISLNSCNDQMFSFVLMVVLILEHNVAY